MLKCDFTGKNAIVTGGTGGIGRSVVEEIAQGGGHVYLLYHSKPDVAEEIAKEIGEDKIFPRQLDVSDPAAVREGFNKLIEEAGHIDVLVNVAGVISKKPFVEISQDEWDRTIAINLTAIFACCQAVYPHMVARGSGRIVNVSSVASKVGGGFLGTAAYASSKAGVNALTKAIAKEGGPYGVSCNAVCPSLTRTPMTVNMGKEKWDKLVSTIPLKRCAEPAEVANVITFYASDLASFCNGEIAKVDGGLILDG